MSLKAVHFRLDLVEALPISQIEYNKSSLRPTEVHALDGSELLLAGCVPNVGLHSYFTASH